LLKFWNCYKCLRCLYLNASTIQWGRLLNGNFQKLASASCCRFDDDLLTSQTETYFVGCNIHRCTFNPKSRLTINFFVGTTMWQMRYYTYPMWEALLTEKTISSKPSLTLHTLHWVLHGNNLLISVDHIRESRAYKEGFVGYSYQLPFRGEDDFRLVPCRINSGSDCHIIGTSAYQEFKNEMISSQKNQVILILFSLQGCRTVCFINSINRK
jgi:hypothetical protein